MHPSVSQIVRRVCGFAPLPSRLRPNPAYRERRLAQFTPERVERYHVNAMLVQDKSLASQVDWARRNMLDALRRDYRIAAERLRHG